jgi:hypothetical protein
VRSAGGENATEQQGEQAAEDHDVCSLD